MLEDLAKCSQCGEFPCKCGYQRHKSLEDRITRLEQRVAKLGADKTYPSTKPKRREIIRRTRRIATKDEKWIKLLKIR